MDAALRVVVRQRAGGCCEYRRISQELDSFYTFHVEHIVALQHGGSDDTVNLALSCPSCNRFKGPNLTAIDPQTGSMARLFHPRQDRWDRHFSINSGIVAGLTARGRATVSLLRMNETSRVALRRMAFEEQ